MINARSLSGLPRRDQPGCVQGFPENRQPGSYPETLVLYRMRPIRRAQVGS
jgi:hypothetical protein